MNESLKSPAQMGYFGDLPVDGRLAGALATMGYTHPTPIQEQAIPPLREGRDVIGLARTGSGKTAGFGIPLVESIRLAERHVQALVLVPTRELAAQVASELTRLGATSGVRVAAVYGGVGMGAQIAALHGGAHVVVGTPGRVIDHLTRGTMALRHTRFVILDEADRMLDVGFAPAIDDILRRIPGPRQTALFSATFPAEVEALAARHTRAAVRVAVDPPGASIETLEQRFVRVPQGKEKTDTLHDILIGQDCRLALVFRRTTHRTDKLARDLEQRGFRVAALHGRRTQGQRERALEALRAGRLQVLVATDIAARGLDITGLTHVVNFDLPDTADSYTHRVGRTARMGADGVAITLVGPDDEEALRAIQRKLPATGALAEPAGTSHAAARRHDRGERAAFRPGGTPGQASRGGRTRGPHTDSVAATGAASRRRNGTQSSTLSTGSGRSQGRVAQGGRSDGARHVGAPAGQAPGKKTPADNLRDETPAGGPGWYPFHMASGTPRKRRP